MLESLAIGIFAILFFVLAWVRFQFALDFVLLLLPAYLIRFQIAFVPLTVLEVMVLICVLVFAIRLIRHDIPHFFFPWRWMILLFLLTGIVAVLISPDLRQGLGLYKAYMVEPVLFFLVLVNTRQGKQGAKRILWALGVSVVLIGYVAFLQTLHILPIPNNYGLQNPPRATSLFPFPTAVGKFVGPLLAFFIGFFLIRFFDGRVKKYTPELIFILGIILFGSLGLLLSVSRGAMIGVFIATIFSACFAYKKPLLLSILAGIIVIALALPMVRTNIVEVFHAQDTSTDVHLIMWKGTWRIIQDYPITGTGLASFPMVYDLYRDPAHVELFPNPDQLILTIWVELGLAGLLVFGWLWAKYIAACRRIFHTDRAMAIGLLAALIALFVHGLVDTPYFKNDLAIMFWALAACAVLLDSSRQKTTADKKE